MAQAASGMGEHSECEEGERKSPRLVEEGTVPVQKDVTGRAGDVTGRAGDDEGECVTWSGSCSSELKQTDTRWQ